MSESLTFLMGKHPAVLPNDRKYCRNHMWCQQAGGVLRFGFTTSAVRLMQDVYFLDWQVSAGDALAHKQLIGHIEDLRDIRQALIAELSAKFPVKLPQ